MGAVKERGPSPRSNGVWSFAITATHLPMVNALRKIGEHMQTTREPLERYAEFLAFEARKAFATESSNTGEPWTPRIGKGSRALLVLTGKIKGVVTSPKKGTIKLTDRKLIFGIRKHRYAIAQNFGRKKKGYPISNIPPRPFLDFNDLDDTLKHKLVEIVSDWQTEIITRANRRMAAM
jgi:phage gpG-like protein